MTARLFIAAAHKSSGKTTVALGLAAALRARGTVLQAFKKGPDYIDPMWLAHASGRPCFNLDPHLMSGGEIDALFAGATGDADLALVEGNHGLFDGMALDGSDCNAALAKQLQAPVLLVVDVRGTTRGVAPLLRGHLAFDPALRIGGVVLNRVGGARHEARLREVLAHYCPDIPVLGAVHEQPLLAVTERHLGLMPTTELDDADERVAAIAAAIASAVDLDAVLALGRSAPPRAVTPGTAPPATTASPVRIAIARDRAFGFYYPDDLAALQAAGAELVFFDSLHDARLPACDGLFVGGGFPEACMDALAANAALRADVQHAVEAGLPTYAECGGLMWLSRSLSWQGRRVPMVGAIPGDAVMQPRPVGRGYVRLHETAAMPWPGGAPGGELRAHEFHHSRLENIDPGVAWAYRVDRGHGVDGRHDGLLVHRVLASYTHRRSTGRDGWAPRFVAHVRACARSALGVAA